MTVCSDGIRSEWNACRKAAGRLAIAGQHRAAQFRFLQLTQDSESSAERATVLNDLAALCAADDKSTAAVQTLIRALRFDPGQRAVLKNLHALAARIPNPSLSADARPRIAVLSLLFNWPSTGGGTVHTKELAEALQAGGYDVRHIYAVYAPWGLGRVTEPLFVSSMPLFFNEHDWTPETIQDKFRDAVDEFAPDAIFIADSWNTKPLLAEAVADYPYFLRLAALETICPLNNVRLLCENHQLIQCDRNQLAEPQACRTCVARNAGSSGGLHQAERALAGFFDDDYPDRLRRAYRGAEAVLAVNPTIADLVRPYCRQVEIVPSGFDPARFPAPDIATPQRATQFLFAGLVDEPMKGFSVLWEACRRLALDRHDFQLVVTSDRRPEWDAAFIQWVGWQTQAELPRVIRDCDVLVFPTLAQEALGRTAVEAMGCGKPVIASCIGGLGWVVEDGTTGLLANPGDPGDLAAKMVHLMDWPDLRAQLGRAGRAKFEREFPWPVILERHYRPLLKQVVAQPRP